MAEIRAGLPLQAPFPWFGGKSRVAPLIWDAFGDVPNYVEPFAGSLAVLLGRPHAPQTETVNDADGFLCNFWRAVEADPEQVARYADGPVNECDLHARHAWLKPRRADLTRRLEGDPDYYDAKIAGWWCWGICCWIGGGWCSADGPWVVEDGRLIRRKNGLDELDGEGVNRQLPHLGDAGRGVKRQRPHLGKMGVRRQRPHLGNAWGTGMGVHVDRDLVAWFLALQNRLRRVRVCCGDWTRVMGPTVTFIKGMTGVFLDPPYSHSERNAGLYGVETDVMQDVAAWCRENGDNPLLRIALCGYDDIDMPGWRVYHWQPQGGYGLQGHGRGRANRDREQIWFSPACIDQNQLELFT